MPKLAFTVKDFKDGIKFFETNIAHNFVVYVQDAFREKKIDFTLIEQELLPGGKKIDQRKFAEGLTAEKGVVFVQDKQFIEQYTFREIMWILEKGRKDKQILPHPVLRQLFDEYRPIYKLALRNFLLGKKD